MIRTKIRTRLHHPIAERFLIGVLLFEGVLGLIGGVLLVAAPNGSLLQMSAAWLQGTPFADYFVPGLLLAGALGLLPISAAFLLWRAPSIPAWHMIERQAGFSTAWLASFAAGMAMMIWIVTQVAMVQMFHPMQVFVFALGLAIVLLALLPSVRSAHRCPRA